MQALAHITLNLHYPFKQTSIHHPEIADKSQAKDTIHTREILKTSLPTLGVVKQRGCCGAEGVRLIWTEQDDASHKLPMSISSLMLVCGLMVVGT